MKTYKKASKDKYSKKLFDLADEIDIKQLPKGGGYIGVPSSDIDAEGDIKWYYICEPDAIDKERYGGQMVEIFKGLLDCDEFGNLYPNSKQKTVTKDGKQELRGHSLRLDASEMVLYVNEKTDLDWDKYETMGKKARENNPPIVTYGPKGKDNGFAARQEARAKKKADNERKARWAARGELYSPWGSHTKWPEEFQKLVDKYRDDQFHGKDTGDVDLFLKAKEYGVDPDELAQYLSEARGIAAEAYSNFLNSNN